MNREGTLECIRKTIKAELVKGTWTPEVREKFIKELIVTGGADSLTKHELTETLKAINAGVCWSWATITAKVRQGATASQIVQSCQAGATITRRRLIC